MKNIYLILVFLFSVIFTSGQDWKPLKNGYKYNYLENSSNHVLTLWVDSVSVNKQGDSVYYLNRVIKKCDTCTKENQQSYYLNNQPQFLQRKYTMKDDQMIFMNPDTFGLITKFKPESSWLWQETDSTRAKCLNIEEKMIFGKNDSVAVIELSTRDTIRYSKNHGILSFARDSNHYELIGIEGLEVGLQVPTFFDFFEFDEGDVFHYYHDGFQPEMDPCGLFVEEQYEIISKSQSEEHVSYRIKGFKNKCSPYPPKTFFEKISKSISFQNMPDHPLNKYHGELVYPYLNRQIIADSIVSILMVKYINDTIIKEYGSEGKDIDKCILLYETNKKDVYRTVCHSTDINRLYATFKENVGLTNYELGLFEYRESKQLVGYNIDGKAQGNLAPLHLMDINDDIHKNEIHVFPQPCKDYLRIKFLSRKNSINVGIYDIIGKQCKSIYAEDNKEIRIDMNDCKKGIYLLTIYTEERIILKKILKQ